jgi:hypothetical protein
MAGNNFNINPIVIDTPGAGDLVGASAPVRLMGIMWDCGTSGATGDRCVVTDSAGNSIFESTVITSLAGTPAFVDFPFPLTVKGLKVPTLTHGKVFLYLA